MRMNVRIIKKGGMVMGERAYLCIDLKSFYASVECVERGLDPMKALLVVADPERSEKTICLAVSPAMKALGVKNRCRVFEIPKNISYIMAPPRMQKYIDYAAAIYGVYLQYISPDDIHVYSIDEAFLDVTPYLQRYGKTPREMAVMLMEEVWKQVGVRAACGIGSNLYLAKVALDITAKHARDFIGWLDEAEYRKTLWRHQPLTDFWRIGHGISQRLSKYGIYTMEQLAHAEEELLYREFGIDAELLIDHAWGRESATIPDIHAFTPRSNSFTSGQVLMRDYTFEEGKIIVREMMDALCLDMAAKHLVTPSVSLMVGYAKEDGGPMARGTAAFGTESNVDRVILPAVSALYERIVDPEKKIRRMYLNCNQLQPQMKNARQVSFFDTEMNLGREKDRMRQEAVVDIHRKFGKNALLRGIDLLDAATARERNLQIGGHKSGE